MIFEMQISYAALIRVH